MKSLIFCEKLFEDICLVGKLCSRMRLMLIVKFCICINLGNGYEYLICEIDDWNGCCDGEKKI